MKTLKFMLAAATAIGIASVASAAQYTGASTGFEKFTQTTKAKYGALDSSGANDYYFWYDDTNQDDNESEIVALTGDLSTVERPKGTKKFTGADAAGNDNALQVSTGTKPLLRTIKPAAADGPLPGEDILTSTYVDTLVQFTVTPSTDTVTPGESDKLMIYLKENAVMDQDGVPTGETTTNLMVTAGYCGVDGAISAKAYKASNVTVEPGKWYRLTVEAIPDITVEDPTVLPTEKNGFVGFVVKINNDQCQFSDPMYNADDETAAGIFGGSYLLEAIDGKMLVLSLLAASENASKNTLQAVGFAGEGLVDDLVITTSDPFSSMFNFTLNLGDNVTAIDYTIGGLPYSQMDKFVEDLKAGTVIMIQSITYAAGFELDSLTTAGLTATAENTYTIDGGDVDPSITITAKAKAASEVTPGVNSGSYDNEEAANAAAANMVIKATAPADSGITDAEYTSYFKKVVVKGADGKFSVTAELDETVVDPDATAAELAGKFDKISESEASEVTVVAKPGLYYSVKQGSSLGDMKEGVRTMATGGTVNLKARKFPGAGFYQIMVNFQ